jgi:hypothetical protein
VTAVTSPVPTDWRAALDVAADALAEMRLQLAIARDDRLTDQELIAMLEVYQEFGR